MIVSVSGPFVLISNCYSNVVRAEGESGKAMMGQLIGNLLNIILDPILILVFSWNIAWAAIATVIGNVVGASLHTVFCKRKVYLEYSSQRLFCQRQGGIRCFEHRNSSGFG